MRPVRETNGPTLVPAMHESAVTSRVQALTAEITDAIELLERIDAWDVMDTTQDGRYWREDEIRPLLARLSTLIEEPS